VRNAGGTYAAIIDPTGLKIMNADGNTAAASLGFDSGKLPLLQLGNGKTGGVTAGLGASGTGFVEVRTGTGQPGIALGQHDKSPLAVTVFDTAGANSVAQLGRADGSGVGRLLVRGEAQTVATLGPSQLGRLGLTIGTNAQAPGATFSLLGDGSGQAVLSDVGGGEVVLGGFKTAPPGVRLLDSAGGER
jgi:hypothetical protein